MRIQGLNEGQTPSSGTQNDTECSTVRFLLHKSYANLAMAHYSVKHSDLKYSRVAYSIRARLFKGLQNGTMSIGSMYEDEKIKATSTHQCVYCLGRTKLSLDHIISRSKGGADTGDNLVVACIQCNSSKGSKDLLDWFNEQGVFPPLLVLRRYLKIAIQLCDNAGVLDCSVEDSAVRLVPINIAGIPTKYPPPAILRL